jgi:hypothetical protein
MLRLIEQFEKADFITMTVVVGGVAIWGRARLDEEAESLVFAYAKMFLPSGMVTASMETVVPLARIDAWHGAAFQLYTVEGKRVVLADIVLV